MENLLGILTIMYTSSKYNVLGILSITKCLHIFSGGGKDTPDLGNSQSMSSFLKRALRLEGPQLTQRAITIKKNVRESLGMRIGGGIGSNEGDTPIYVANIHPHGCIGKSKQLKVRVMTTINQCDCFCNVSHYIALHIEDT